MQLKVTLLLPGNHFLEEDAPEFTITDFQDAEKIGLKAGRAIRDFIRNVPLRAGHHHERVAVDCVWEEQAAAEPKPRRRKKAKASNGSES